MPLLSDTSAEDTELLKTKRRESLDIIVDKLKQQVRAGQRAQVVEVAGAVRLRESTHFWAAEVLIP